MKRNQYSGTARRARLAAAVLVGTMVLPGLAVADHTTCTPGEITNTCQEFDPQFEAGAETPFTDSPSVLTLRMSQTQNGPTSGHDAPVLGVNYLLPKWQFGLNSTRPGEVSDGPNIGDPSTTCADVIVGEENDADGAPATLGRAENIAGRAGQQNPLGYVGLNARLSGGSVIQFNVNRSLSLAHYDAVTGTALLCWYAYTTSTSIANQAAREHIIPITLQKVTLGEMLNGEDISQNFGWKMSYDLTSLYGHPALFNAGIGIIDQLLSFSSNTPGNWHIDDVTGQPASALFSKTPKAPAYAEYRGTYTTCLEGFKPANPAITTTEAAEALAPQDLCTNGTLYTTGRSVFEDIRHPPNAIVHDFGKLTGPVTAGMPTRYALVRGTNNVTFRWTPPALAGGEKVKGYLLTVAKVGQVNTMHFEHLITNPADPGFDARQPCGADGLASPCSLTLTFPLNTIGPSQLPVNGKFDASLVTIYEGQNGATDIRTDGMCDDGTGFGVACPLTDPAFRIASHSAFDYVRLAGLSTWQFLLREKAWPMTFVDTATVRHTPNGPTWTAPSYVLLVDFALRQGEIVRWNPLTFEQSFFAPSNRIIGDNTAGGLVSFATASMTGHQDNWRYDGFIQPNGLHNASSIPPGVRPFAQAKGFFLLYNLHGAPGQTPTAFPDLICTPGAVAVPPLPCKVNVPFQGAPVGATT